jgi:hypothetical protein
MTDALTLLEFLTVAVLGVAAGALVAEGAVLVPMWRRMPAAAFFAWYREHAGLLFRFFGTLEVVAALLVLTAFGLRWLATRAPSPALAAAAALTVAVLAVFPLYFQRVNASFEQATIPPEHVGGELARWARWHWLRTVLALGAFAAALGAGR